MSEKDARVIGELDNESGAGVYGHNKATSGDAIGVMGATASGSGYGLYTDEDAHVGGSLSADRVNGVRWASSPDDINTQLANLPDYGGVVRLIVIIVSRYGIDRRTACGRTGKQSQ